MYGNKYVPQVTRTAVPTTEDPNKDVTFGDKPVNFVSCPHCQHRDGTTYIEYEVTLFTWAMVFLVLFCFNFLPALLILWAIWKLIKDVVHRCPNCHNVMESSRRLKCDLFNVKKELVTVQFGD